MKLDTRKLIFAGLLIALMIVLQITNIGLIRIPPVAATTLHIPVIIGTIVCGLGVGLILGTAFGVISLINAITAPSVLSPLFLNPLVSIVPRVLIAVTTFAAYMALKRLGEKRPSLQILIAAAVGSLTNTVLVLGTMALLYGETVASLLKMEVSTVVAWAVGIGTINGVPEMAICAFLTWAVVSALKRTRRYKEWKGNAT